MKLAIVHDDFLQWGGAERVVQAIAEVWPQAPIYTSVADPHIVHKRFSDKTIYQSFLQLLPATTLLRRFYLPMYPISFQQLDLKDYDVLLSSSTRFAHTVRKSVSATHITYMHAPPRFVWEFDSYINNEQFASLKRIMTRPIVRNLRYRDLTSSQDISYWLANSNNVAKKIQKIYRRKADVLYPFVDTKLFTVAKRTKSDGYFLVVSRLVAWKHIDIAIEACKKLHKKLIIIGKGPDKRRLQKIALGSNTTFIEELTDALLVTYYRNCDALIMTQNEDFGLTPLEAQACGRPVIAYGRGGALETVVAGQTGTFFKQQTARSLFSLLTTFDPDGHDPAICRLQAMRFSKVQFQRALKTYVLQKAREV